MLVRSINLVWRLSSVLAIFRLCQSIYFMAKDEHELYDLLLTNIQTANRMASCKVYGSSVIWHTVISVPIQMDAYAMCIHFFLLLILFKRKLLLRSYTDLCFCSFALFYTLHQKLFILLNRCVLFRIQLVLNWLHVRWCNEEKCKQTKGKIKVNHESHYYFNKMTQKKIEMNGDHWR